MDMYDDEYAPPPKDIQDILREKALKQPSKSDTSPSTEENPEYILDSINTLSQFSIVFHGYTKPFKLRSTDILLLAIIATYSYQKRMCWHSQKSLAVLTGVSEPTVKSSLGKLKQLGLIERGPRHPKYGTDQWKLGLEGERKMYDIQKELGRYKKDRDASKKFGSRPKET